MIMNRGELCGYVTGFYLSTFALRYWILPRAWRMLDKV